MRTLRALLRPCCCVQVKEAMRARRNITYVSCSDAVRDAMRGDVMRSVKDLLPDVLHHIHVLLYQVCVRGMWMCTRVCECVNREDTRRYATYMCCCTAPGVYEKSRERSTQARVGLQRAVVQQWAVGLSGFAGGMPTCFTRHAPSCSTAQRHTAEPGDCRWRNENLWSTAVKKLPWSSVKHMGSTMQQKTQLDNSILRGVREGVCKQRAFETNSEACMRHNNQQHGLGLFLALLAATLRAPVCAFTAYDRASSTSWTASRLSAPGCPPWTGTTRASSTPTGGGCGTCRTTRTRGSDTWPALAAPGAAMPALTALTGAWAAGLRCWRVRVLLLAAARGGGGQA